jgi:hypothetical protein
MISPSGNVLVVGNDPCPVIPYHPIADFVSPCAFNVRRPGEWGASISGRKTGDGGCALAHFLNFTELPGH